jgi:hypothetical protein
VLLLCSCDHAVNGQLGPHKERRTLERRVGTTKVPDLRGGSVGVGRATDFHQNLLRGVQTDRSLALLSYPGRELTLSSTLSELKCNSIASIVPLMLSSKREATSELMKTCKNKAQVTKGLIQTQRASFSPSVFPNLVLFRMDFQIGCRFLRPMN